MVTKIPGKEEYIFLPDIVITLDNWLKQHAQDKENEVYQIVEEVVAH